MHLSRSCSSEYLNNKTCAVCFTDLRIREIFGTKKWFKHHTCLITEQTGAKSLEMPWVFTVVLFVLSGPNWLVCWLNEWLCNPYWLMKSNTSWVTGLLILWVILLVSYMHVFFACCCEPCAWWLNIKINL